MTRTLVLAALALAALAGPGWAEDKAEKKLKAGDRDPAFLGRVNSAVEKGVKHLLSKQDEDGHWKSYFDDFQGSSFTKGATALCLFALLKSGVNRNDKQIKKGFDWLRKRWQAWCDFGQPLPPQKDAWFTYDVGTTMLALEALYRAPKRRAVGVRKDITRVVAPRRKARLMKADFAWMRQLAAFLHNNMGLTSRTVSSDGGTSDEVTTWSYPKENVLADRSNTQFAVLGLAAASRCGVVTEPKIWQKVLQNFLSFQSKHTEARVARLTLLEDSEHGYVSYKPVSRVLDEARGWAYYTGKLPEKDGDEWNRCTGSMTAVGVSCVLICMDELTKARKLKPGDRTAGTRAAWNGMAWLTHRFSVEKNPGNEKKWTYYYLYGLERSAVLAGTRNIGKHDWYREGAEWLMKRQSGAGWWCGQGEGEMVATCLALLFLTKATTPGFVKISGK